MNRVPHRASRAQGVYDWSTHEGTRRRNEGQIDERATPDYPATGTTRIAAMLHEARRRRVERPPGAPGA